MIVAHADWGVDARKQWVAVARRDSRGRWTAFAPQRVLQTGTLKTRLHVDDNADTAIMGFDFPIGIPRAYAERARIANFLEFLWGDCGENDWREFFDVADDRHEISLNRPFYPRTYLPKGSKKREHLESALGIDFNALLRRCDRANPEQPTACPISWTCGGNQVGTHSKALLGCADKLGVLLDSELEGTIRDGFGTRRSGEDAFDAVIGMLGMVNVLEHVRPAGAPSDDARVRTVEGWMLGRAAT